MTIGKTACYMAIIAASLVLLLQSDFIGGYADRPNHKIVLSKLRCYQAIFEESGIPIEEVRDFVRTGELQGSITPDLLEFMNMADVSMTDVWGNRYHSRLLSSGKIGLYSLGRDEKSATEGEDPDDISSWNGSGSTCLNEEASARNKKNRSVAVSVIVLLSALWWRVFCETTRRAQTSPTAIESSRG